MSDGVNSFDDFVKQRGNECLIVASFDDVEHIQKALKGQRTVEVTSQPVPAELSREFEGELDFSETVLISALLQNCGISLTTRVWMDKETFRRA